MNARIIAWPALACLLTGAPGRADDRDRLQVRDRDRVTEHDLTPDQDRVRLQLRDQLHRALAVTEAELATLDPELVAFARSGAGPAPMRAAVGECLRQGCRGECLAEAVRSMNTAMRHGSSAKQAGNLVAEAAREQRREQAQVGDAERGSRIRARVEARLERMERDQERARERSRERAHQPGRSGPGR